MTESLQKIYDRNKRGDWPDKGTVHSYIEVYEAILRPYKYTAKNILEIGLMSGESLRMWNEYFAGDVYGMDCSITPIDGLADLRPAIREGYNIRIGDASNPADVHKHFYGKKFDVVIEDAGHSFEQQLNIFQTIQPYLKEGAIYIIEDVQDIDKDRALFEAWGETYFIGDRDLKIIDRRKVKGRYDDVLVIIKN